MNWLVFAAGYHTVHHEHAGTHWSEYPALHAARVAQIAPALNPSSLIGYCFGKYVAGPCARALGLSETDCDSAAHRDLPQNQG